MNKYITIAAAGVLAITASLAATAPSSAFYPGAGIAAGFIGFAAGAALATAAEDHYDHYRNYGSSWDDHVAACYDAYRSYSVRSDSYVRVIDGEYVRVRCEL